MLKPLYAVMALACIAAAFIFTMSLTSEPGSAADPGCVQNCGTPRNFCDTWAGGFCDDYRAKATGNTHVPFPAPGDPYTFDAFSTTTPFDWQTNGPAPADGLRAFSANEHFMTVIDDSQFGLGVLRLQQPFDFAGREGHVHFDVDLKTSARRYVRFMVSPELVKSLTDDRQPADRKPPNAFDLWFVNGTFKGQVVRGGADAGGFDLWMNRYYGDDDVRDSVDVYIRRNSVRILVNGQTMAEETIPDLGFDRGYVYLSQASYNPCKGWTDEAFAVYGAGFECTEPAQMFHWDNVAFDGPALPRNSLTPPGYRDVVFNAFSASACSVKGVAAQPIGAVTQYVRVTWRARLANDGSALSPANVACTFTNGYPDGQHADADAHGDAPAHRHEYARADADAVRPGR
jgi:hypothetical protein